MRLPRGHKAQVTGQRYIQTMYTAEQMREAVEREREACAKLCDEYETEDDITTTWLNIVADAIRARGNT